VLKALRELKVRRVRRELKALKEFKVLLERRVLLVLSVEKPTNITS